jgi:hypothetical protein
MFKNFKQLEKWHSLCTLKGIDVVEEQYSINEINELLDHLETHIQDNEPCYRAAIEARRMKLTNCDLDNYYDYLEQKEAEREEARRKSVEDNNPILKKLRTENNFIKYGSSTHSIDLLKNKEKISVQIKINEISNNRWLVEYSWRDRGLNMMRSVVWKPNQASIKCPPWFPDHWKSQQIFKEEHMAAYVAYKLISGRARDMGIVPGHTKVSFEITAIEDLKELA